MIDICLQVGHWNIQNNTDAALHGSTGAPGEMETNKAITFRAAELLRSRGFNAVVTDANANSDPNITGRDWRMFLAVHCDANTATLSAGFTDWPDPATDDSTLESQRIANAISSKFYPESGITFHPERRQKSPDIMYYYMWKFLSGPTPCVLIEMGERQDPHDSIILQDTERCAAALARGVCAAFSVPYDQPAPTPPAPAPQPAQPITDPQTKVVIRGKTMTLKEAGDQLTLLENMVKDAKASIDRDVKMRAAVKAVYGI